MSHEIRRRAGKDRRSWTIALGFAMMLVIQAADGRAQTSSSSRPMSATVVATYVTHDGELALLVLWRGSPGWYGGGGHSSHGGGGRDTAWLSETYGSRTFTADIDYAGRVAKMLSQEISLVDTNIVLVDGVDGQPGAHVVGRLRVDPQMPEIGGSAPRTMSEDPAIVAIRRAPEAGAFLQCDTPLPMPAGVDAANLDPAALARMREYLQGVLTEICRAANTP